MLGLIVTLLLIAILLYVVKMFIPIDTRIMNVIYILIGIWIVLQLLGLVGYQVPYISRLH